MPIKVTTTYTEKLMARFQMHIALSKKALWTFMSVCSIFVLTMCTIVLIQNGFIMKTFIYMALVLGIDFSCVLVNFILPRVNVKKLQALGSVVEYSFDEDEIGVRVESKTGRKSEGKMPYNSLWRVVRSGQTLYLFIGKVQAYIVDISELDETQKRELKRLFTKKIDPKRIKY